MTSKYNSVSVLDPFWLRKWKAGSFTSVGLGSGACLSQKNAVHGWSILTVGRVAILPIASPNLAKNVSYQVTAYKHGLNSATRFSWNEMRQICSKPIIMDFKSNKSLSEKINLFLSDAFRSTLPLTSTSQSSIHFKTLLFSMNLSSSVLALLKCWSFAGVLQSSPGVLTLFCDSWDHSDVPIREDIKLKYSHHSMELHFINEN